jgi:Rod binding domain-containing protein
MSYSTLLRPSLPTDLSLEGVQNGSKQISGSRADKIRKYAREFEADLLAKVYDGMQRSLGAVPGEEEDPGADTLMDMGIHALTAGIVAGGGLGIANLLIRRLIPQQDTSGATKQT